MRIPTSTAREARFASYEPLISAAIRFGWLLLCSSRLSSPQHFKVGVDQVLTAPKMPMAARAAIAMNT